MNHSSPLSDKDAGLGRRDGGASDQADLRNDLGSDVQDDVPRGLPPQVADGWLHRLARALERAERRITENFRVPPGGG
ncbi:hypothetical protein HNP33_002741 [Comamonas odontotermitis]|uniref:Uncharacterized protein n=1 Tax=Comamonas odontotermitis TaxID=379895 RepID=A0ABR6RHM0_9BURK|nr:hypothetical protein [Comamonas odontotermitis]MBB6578655.1 hypothetical protein [Comamonas odontotermitis]